MRHEFSPRNALRPPDWRWKRARLAATGELPFDRSRDDADVRRAALYIRAVEHAPGGASAAGLAEAEARWPAVFWAHHYWRMADAAGANSGAHAAAGHRHVAARWGLEARVLAGETPGEIAAKSGIHADDVAAYERLFFDVRPRLSQRDYVLHQVIGPAIHRGLRARDYDLLWKLFGYWLGPEALDHLTSTFFGPRRRVPADALGEAMAGSIRSDAARHLAILGKTWQVDRPEAAIAVVSLYENLLKAEREAGTAGGDDPFASHFGKVLQLVDYAVGRPAAAAARGPAPAALAALDASAAEPSGAALVGYSLGEGPDPDPEVLAVDFPPPPAHRREAH